MPEKIYHVGIGKQNNGKTMVIEARQNVDYLSCEIYDYFGKRITTKAKLNCNRYDILQAMQSRRPDVYSNCNFAIVN